METIEHIIPYKSRAEEFHIYPIGDIHAGVKHCDEEAIRNQIKLIKNDTHGYWVGMGDYADLITRFDSRWDIDVMSEWVEKSNIAESQRRWLVELFKPIKSKCLGLLYGNHEESCRLFNSQDIHLNLCRDLEVPNLGFSCFVSLIFKRLTGKNDSTVSSFLKIICRFEHGSGAAQSDGGKMNRLKQGMYAFEGDIYGMGHLHDIKIDKMPYLYLGNNKKIRERLKVGAITGSWFRAYRQGIRASYAERKGYRPTPVGCPMFVIKPDKARVDVRS